MDLADPVSVVVMGVSGIGKSSVGAALAEQLSARFVDGDHLHSAENIAAMSRGVPLTDEDRWPWLRRIGGELASAREQRRSVVIACSALRRRYRDEIASQAPAAVFLCLTAPMAVVGSRMAARRGHFMPAALLDSQFAALELPDADERAVLIDVNAPFDDVVSRAAARLAEVWHADAQARGSAPST